VEAENERAASEITSAQPPRQCTHRDLGENIEQQGQNGKVDLDPLASKPLPQILWHRHHLHDAREVTTSQSDQGAQRGQKNGIHPGVRAIDMCSRIETLFGSGSLQSGQMALDLQPVAHFNSHELIYSSAGVARCYPNTLKSSQ
jgi:hypothetical protein